MQQHIYQIVIFALISITILSCNHLTEVDLNNPKERNDHFTNFFLKPTNLKIGNNDIDMCERRPYPNNPNYYYFAPVFKAKLYKPNDSNTFKAGCFKSIRATLVELSLDRVVISLEANEAKSATCSDIFIIHTTNINHLTHIFRKGNHEIILKHLTQDDLDEIRVNSIKILGFCQGIFATFKSIYMTLKMFIGGFGNDKYQGFRPAHIPEYMIKANIEMIELYNNYTIQRRSNTTLIELDEKEIHTGDFITVTRFDGVDPLIMIGTGSHSGHSCVAAWIDKELFVLESQDDGAFWPYKGIQKNKWKDWVRMAYEAEYDVIILPMKEEIRKKFDVEKALEWYFNGIEGLNYGYHTFLFSFIDTIDSNLPFSLSHEHFEFLFSILEKISPSAAHLIIGEAVNMRLGTKGLTIPQVAAEAARQGKTFEQLLAEPEIDGWEYSDGMNYVCSCFVAAFYKAGGLFEGLDINANEFTPKDVYQLNFFDLHYKKPQACIDADPTLPYCQIMGRFRIELPGYSTIEPYSHMNERCPSIGPEFYRPPDC